MTTTKRFFASLLALAMVLSIIATPTAQVRAASVEQYCFVFRDGKSYISIFYENNLPVPQRGLTWTGSKLTFLASGETITESMKAGSTPAWAEGGTYLVWQEDGDVLSILKYGETEPVKKSGVRTLTLDTDNMVNSITLVGGNKLTIAELLSAAPEQASEVASESASVQASEVASESASEQASEVASESASEQASEVASESASEQASEVASESASKQASEVASESASKQASESASEQASKVASESASEQASKATLEQPSEKPSKASLSIKISTDSAGQTIYNISNGHKVVVSRENVYLDSYKISELCSGTAVKFVGIDTNSSIYLYETAMAAYYRFKLNNIFSPEKIKLFNATLVRSVTDANNCLTAIETSVGKFSVRQLAVEKNWYPSQTYALNKSGYCQYYLADTNESYILTLKGKNLYLGVKKIQSGITRADHSFGFKGSKIYCYKGSKSYWATIKNPTVWHLWKQNIAKLTYNGKNGTVSGVKRLSVKMDKVVNNKKHTVAKLYQSWSLKKTLKITSKGTKVTLNGKVIAKLSKKQQKAKVKYKAVSFTEDGYIYVETNKAKYRAPLATPKALKKWSISKVKYDKSLGFVSKKS